MWINNSINQPQKEGNYKTLIEVDEIGTLSQSNNDYYDGKDWSHTDSNRQFIRYWWCEKEEYKEISDKHQEELEKHIIRENKEKRKILDKYFKANRPLNEYPIGTKAQSIMGGYWYRTERGWKWNGPDGSGSTFSNVGGDWSGMVSIGQVECGVKGIGFCPYETINGCEYLGPCKNQNVVKEP